MRSLVVATRNPGKVREIAELLADLEVCLVGLPEGAPEVVEDGETFRANAVKKAEAAAALTGCWALADDSGLEVEALGGEPGVWSARFAGVAGAGRDGANNRRLLELLGATPEAQRGARFRCVLALARPGRETLCFEGVVEGRIGREPRGQGGFGYDPLFHYPPLGATFAELAPPQKHAVSHRGRALGALRRALPALLAQPGGAGASPAQIQPRRRK